MGHWRTEQRNGDATTQYKSTRENANTKWFIISCIFPSSFIHSLRFHSFVTFFHFSLFSGVRRSNCYSLLRCSTYRTGSSYAGALRPSGWTPTLVTNIWCAIAWRWIQYGFETGAARCTNWCTACFLSTAAMWWRRFVCHFCRCLILIICNACVCIFIQRFMTTFARFLSIRLISQQNNVL